MCTQPIRHHRRLSSSFSRWCSLAAVSALALAGASAQAATFYVGTGSGCTYNSIQAAINAAQANPGSHTIIVTRSLTYTAQELLVTTFHPLHIIGGYDTCAPGTPSGRTIIDGTGGNTRQVLRVYALDATSVRLRHLTIRGGDEAGAGEGGGIYFQGSGTLEIHDSVISNNITGYGGGIYARGTAPGAKLVIGANVTISNNTARYSGGGVYVDSMTMDMLEPNSVIMFNKALGAGGSGYGGGLTLLGKDHSAYANIGSGLGGLGALYWNEARYGGGVAVVSHDADVISVSSLLWLYSADPNQSVIVRDNFASVAGGAIYIRPSVGILHIGQTRAVLWNATLMDNFAPTGGAAYLANDSLLHLPAAGSKLYFNDPENRPNGAASCTPGRYCGGIVGNATANGNGQFTDGAILHVEEHGTLVLNTDASTGILIQGNRGGRLILAGGDTHVRLHNAAIIDNELSLELMRHPDSTLLSDSYLTISDSTVAGNLIGGSHVISTRDTVVDLKRTILWQPGKTILLRSSGSQWVDSVIANEIASLAGGPDVVLANPRFVDPARGDYGLRAASPAIDFAPAHPGDDRDALGHLRDRDLPLVPDVSGPRDIGAFERQTLQPLVLFGNFNNAGDLNLWPQVTLASSTFDATQNASGPSGSGSVYVNRNSFTPPFVVARRQCVHLPGPGRYKLNGWGRGGGAVLPIQSDATLLRWELRHSGNEVCGGSINATGEHFLTNATSWVKPANPAIIDLAPEDWTTTSSIAISLVVRDNGTPAGNNARGWFDGITLEVEPLGDLIFANGFQP